MIKKIRLAKGIASFVFNEKAELIQLSFLMLFVELILIRWSSASIYYLCYFSNFIVLASFLGIGIGFLKPKRSFNLFHFAPLLFALFIYLSYQFAYQYKATVNPLTGNLHYYGTLFKDNIYPVWLSLPIIFLSVTMIMACIAEGVARAFHQFPPLTAYRLEVIGSLLGIAAFALLSFTRPSPTLWGIVIAILFIVRLMPTQLFSRIPLFLLQLSALLVMMMVFYNESNTFNHVWSSYYKIEAQAFSDHRYVLNVNGLAQQVIESVQQRKAIKPFYFLPYEHMQTKKLDRVLIIGAGTGGDVAIALAQGAKEVDAVEIDPAIYQIGKKLNPDKAYQNPNVHVFINDGRAFLQSTQTKYDLIIFALTDSLMLIPGQSSLRLENYLYTIESIKRVARLLKPDGVFAIYNYYHSLPWLTDRLANTMTQVFQQTPCLDYFGAEDYWATVLTISHAAPRLQCKERWQGSSAASSAPATDNHPFLYLQENKLSTMYFAMLTLILAASLLCMRMMRIRYQTITAHFDLFLMGTAFLLLETKNIIQFSLLFGTTWFVNALVFIGILTTVLFAIETTERHPPLPLPILYVALLLSLMLTWLTPNEFLLMLPAALRFIVASTMAFCPIYLANLIFAIHFNSSLRATEAFGANLMGAMFGGLLEYLSLMIGYNDLLILVAVIYSVAMLFARHRKRTVIFSLPS